MSHYFIDVDRFNRDTERIYKLLKSRFPGITWASGRELISSEDDRQIKRKTQTKYLFVQNKNGYILTVAAEEYGVDKNYWKEIIDVYEKLSII